MPVANTGIATQLLNAGGGRANAYGFYGLRFILLSGGQSSEKVTIVHSYDNATNAFTFTDSTSLVQFGYLNDTDSTKPYTSLQGTDANARAPCIYSFRSSNASQTWTGGEAGIFRMYGGMMRFIDTQSDFRNENYPSSFLQQPIHSGERGGSNSVVWNFWAPAREFRN